MDVLFGSVDVRDLLPAAVQPSESGGDDTASTPLSAPDLRLLVDRLQVRSLHIKDRVREYVLSHRDDFSAIFSRCADAASCTDALSDDLSQALGVLSDHEEDGSLDVQIRNLANEIACKRRELEERRGALALLETITSLQESLESAKQDANEGRFLRAAESLRSLKVALLIHDGSLEGGRALLGAEPVIYSLLRKKWGVCSDELQGALARLVENGIRFEPENSRVIVSSWINMTDAGIADMKFRSLLEAMEISDCLDYGLAKVADTVIKHVMNPVICNGYMVISTEDITWDSEKKAEAVLTLLPPPEFEGTLDGRSIFSRLLQVIRFTDKYIFYQNAKWMHSFGRLTWQRISELVITYFLSKVVPDDASMIVEFQDIMSYTAEFESSLKDVHFISANDHEDEKLTHFANNIEVHFASRKKIEILVKARNLILQSDFSSAVTGVAKEEYFVELLFQPETCIVSSAAFHLMELVHLILKDVCLSSSRVALEFYHAARDALFLYKAIVPVKLEKQLGTISHEAIIMHNDCLYLSQEVGGLAFEYRSNFPHGVKDCAVFVDMELSFRQMAEDVLGKQVQLVSISLKEAIDGANGFQNTHQVQCYELAKFSVDQVVFILEKVHIIWESVLPKSIYRRTMYTLLDFVFATITKGMLLLDDIAAEETLQLQQLIHIIFESLSSLLKSLVEISEDTLSKENFWMHFDEKIPSIGKFQKLSDLLDMPLKSITEAWDAGVLIRCGFMKSEVRDFVKAIFADSPLRKECLWRIEQTHF